MRLRFREKGPYVLDLPEGTPFRWNGEERRLERAKLALCRYIHLPVQSGSDRVLRRMAREYRRAHYLERIRKIREALPDAVLSTDIIVGLSLIHI